ncbi:MAG: helix-hairpin-helix domain-containing protein [Bacteroidia bacterium]|nr:helix-hairpin-helix domain-containing protein [Bacteroidia bacterium]
MKAKIIILFIVLTCFTNLTFPQVIEEENIPSIEDIIEQISSSAESENIDFTSLTEDLNNFARNPINLNDATEEELGKLQFLTDFEIKSILFYIKKNGPMYTLYELQLVYGLTDDKIQMLLPFVICAPKAESGQFPISKAFTNGRHQVFTRVEQILEQQKGYAPISDSAYMANPNQQYLGSRQKVYLKYKYNYRNKIYWGITAEKDPGENFFNSNKRYRILNDAELNKKMNQVKGFDYYAAHLQVNDIKLYRDIISLRTVCFGDYELQFGQGLTMWSGLGYSKSSSVMNIKKRGYGLKRYSSTNENQFMRGTATTVRIKDFDITGFYSRKKIDANITSVDSSDGEALGVSTLQITGLHTIPGEMTDRHAITETVYGSNVVFNQEYYKLGASYVNYTFSAPLETSVKPYNQFDFMGKQNSDLGFNYQFVIKDMNFFGEAAMSQNGGYAFLNGMSVKMAPQVSMCVLHRNYEKDYQSYYGKAFSESGATANENGLYIGAEVYPYKKIKLSGYYDMYKFPWLKYTISAPSSGFDYLAEASYYLSSRVNMSLRFKQEVKPENISGQTSDITQLENVDFKKLRYQISYTVFPNLRLKNRIDMVEYKKGNNSTQHGYMISQDIFYTLKRIPLSLVARYGIFDIDTYDARIYVYETDVLYASSVPAFYNRGARTYLMAKYTFFKGLDMWFRIAQTYYSNQTTNGSGLNEINGKTKTDVTVQVRYNFK